MSLEPLTYSVFHVGDDGDVLMTLETHSQYSFGGPIELLATFSDGKAGCSNQVPNWVQVNFDFDPNAQSPTAGLRQDFNLLNTSYDEDGSSSYSAMHRHSCVAGFYFNLNMPPTQHSTYNPYSVEAGRSSSYHESPGSYRETVADKVDLFRFTDAPEDEEPIIEHGPEGNEMGLFNDELDDLEDPNNADNDETEQ
ncbi:hypothetical protein V6N12_031682 [Hibiscus sabdariffa]|uniref:Uncharacterized protein n=1 Tax=Hibiscus sabdariffa TaxID=183260 RepID=A0ABR2DV62_9ROSI